MSFPTKLLQRLRGAGSGRQGRPGYALQGCLVVFAKCVCVYALCGAGAGASRAHAAAKCAPVLVLAACCLFVNPSAYGRRVALALAASAAGDALLVWERLAAGMACFAAAHLAYLAAFPRRPAMLLRAAGLVAASALYLPWLRPRGALAQLVPGYGALLCAMCWRARAAGRLAGAGAALFVLSDAALGYHMFASPIPYPSLTVMSTYYAAQLLLALSAITRPAESPAPAQPAESPAPAQPAGLKAGLTAPAVPCGAE